MTPDTLSLTSETQELDAAAYTIGQGPTYKRLTIEDIGLILKWTDEGKTQVEIAQRLGKSQAAISLVLKKIGNDSSQVAKRLLNARSYKSAIRVAHIAEKSRDEDAALKAAKLVLSAAGVTADAKGDSGNQVYIQIGVAQIPQRTATGAKVDIITTAQTPRLQQVVEP
jgi:hypothetical protein